MTSSCSSIVPASSHPPKLSSSDSRHHVDICTAITRNILRAALEQDLNAKCPRRRGAKRRSLLKYGAFTCCPCADVATLLVRASCNMTSIGVSNCQDRISCKLRNSQLKAMHRSFSLHKARERPSNLPQSLPVLSFYIPSHFHQLPIIRALTATKKYAARSVPPAIKPCECNAISIGTWEWIKPLFRGYAITHCEYEEWDSCRVS